MRGIWRFNGYRNRTDGVGELVFGRLQDLRLECDARGHGDGVEVLQVTVEQLPRDNRAPRERVNGSLTACSFVVRGIVC